MLPAFLFLSLLASGQASPAQELAAKVELKEQKIAYTGATMLAPAEFRLSEVDRTEGGTESQDAQCGGDAPMKIRLTVLRVTKPTVKDTEQWETFIKATGLIHGVEEGGMQPWKIPPEGPPVVDRAHIFISKPGARAFSDSGLEVLTDFRYTYAFMRGWDLYAITFIPNDAYWKGWKGSPARDAKEFAEFREECDLRLMARMLRTLKLPKP